MKTFLLHIVFLIVAAAVGAQELDNAVSYQYMAADRYFRLRVDNDYFAARDQQYTEGASFELCLPGLDNFFISKALLRPKWAIRQTSIAVEQAGYTPRDLGNNDLLRNDRPYAGTLLFKTTRINTDTTHRQYLASTLTLGVIGPSALGHTIQYVVHNAIHSQVPKGWDYQIANDAAINYQVNYEKQLLHWRNIFSWQVTGCAMAGTLADKAEAGTTVMIGYFQSPFGDQGKGRIHAFVYDHIGIQGVAYDAVLQGGLFNHDRPYTIPQADMERVIYSNRTGVMVSYGRLYAGIFEYIGTRQFTYGPINRWGGVQLALAL